DKEFIVATEESILHEMKKQNPNKVFIPAPPEDAECACNECFYMKMNTLEKVYLCLKNEQPEILIDEEVRLKAVKSIQRMLEISEQHGL
ncbi:MAG: quinolinate synthase NadA, partial [Dysgonamonadaceae bacterium]|nr:quinolinate synthase NadA [Dysgonamonadaceae bacterium]